MTRLDRARELVAGARAAGVGLTLLGGAAVAELCASARTGAVRPRARRHRLRRVVARPSRASVAFATADGLRSDVAFNAANSDIRMRFLDTDDSHIDVFLDELRLCHAVKWGRSPGEGNTLPLPELLLTKTQVVELEPKDIGDLSALLTDRWDELWAARDRLADLVRNDWGLWRTSRGTFERLAAVPDAMVAVPSGDQCSNTGTASDSDQQRDFVPPSETACAGTTNPRRSDMAVPGTRDVIDGIFADAATGDLEAVLRWWHDDGTLEDVTLAQAFVGKPALRDYLDMYYRALPEVRYEPIRLMVSGETAMVEWMQTARDLRRLRRRRGRRPRGRAARDGRVPRRRRPDRARGVLVRGRLAPPAPGRGGRPPAGPGSHAAARSGRHRASAPTERSGGHDR